VAKNGGKNYNNMAKDGDYCYITIFSLHVTYNRKIIVALLRLIMIMILLIMLMVLDLSHKLVSTTNLFDTNLFFLNNGHYQK
jgi:hypothetical protein